MVGNAWQPQMNAQPIWRAGPRSAHGAAMPRWTMPPRISYDTDSGGSAMFLYAVKKPAGEAVKRENRTDEGGNRTVRLRNSSNGI